MNLIDAHCHGQKETRNITPIYSLDPRHDDFSLAPKSYFTYGIHPWWIHEVEFEKFVSRLEKMQTHKNFLALGECGLDRHRDQYFAEQIVVFEKQIVLAKELKISTLTLHSVRAFSDILGSLKKHQWKGSIFFHDYNGNPETTKQLLEWDSYFSFGFKLLDEKTKAYQSSQLIPTNRIFLETDDFEVNLSDLYLKLAQIKKLDLESLQIQIQQNFRQCFKKDFIDR